MLVMAPATNSRSHAAGQARDAQFLRPQCNPDATALAFPLHCSRAVDLWRCLRSMYRPLRLQLPALQEVNIADEIGHPARAGAS
jgi:hypothetical protein